MRLFGLDGGVQMNEQVRLIPFKNHINIEAKTVLEYKEDLEGYKVTPKGMLQIFINQQIPDKLLRQIFERTLS